MSIAGSTGALLKRNLLGLDGLIGEAVADVGQASSPAISARAFSLTAFIADAAAVGGLLAEGSGCTLWVPDVDPKLTLCGNRELLFVALTNLMENAFKFTQPNTEVMLRAYGVRDRILIEVRDHCGGLAPRIAEKLSEPFARAGNDQGGLGPGLSVAAQSVQANAGTLSVRNLPGVGRVFTIELPAQSM